MPVVDLENPLPMRIKELIAELQACDPEAEIKWYHLEDYFATEMELQSIINDAGTTRPIVEITVQPFGSSEGGEQCLKLKMLESAQDMRLQ